MEVVTAGGSYELIRHNVSSQMKYNVMYYTDFHFSEHGTSSINHSSVRSFCIFQLRVLFERSVVVCFCVRLRHVCELETQTDADQAPGLGY